MSLPDHHQHSSLSRTYLLLIQPSVFHPKQTRKEEPSEVSYQSLARPPKKPVAPARATPQLKKQPSRKKIEKSQEPMSAEEIKAANHRALEEFEEEEAKKAVLLLPNTGDNSDSSDDADDPPSYIKEESDEAAEDEESLNAENERLKAYLSQLQDQKEHKEA